MLKIGRKRTTKLRELSIVMNSGKKLNVMLESHCVCSCTCNVVTEMTYSDHHAQHSAETAAKYYYNTP